MRRDAVHLYSSMRSGRAYCPKLRDLPSAQHLVPCVYLSHAPHYCRGEVASVRLILHSQGVLAVVTVATHNVNMMRVNKG